MLIVFAIVFLVSLVSVAGWVFSLGTAVFIVVLYAFCEFAVSPVKTKWLNRVLFVSVFTAVPIGVMSLLAAQTNLSQRIGGRDVFVAGRMTGDGLVHTGLILMVTALAIVLVRQVRQRIFREGSDRADT